LTKIISSALLVTNYYNLEKIDRTFYSFIFFAEKKAKITDRCWTFTKPTFIDTQIAVAFEMNRHGI